MCTVRRQKGTLGNPFFSLSLVPQRAVNCRFSFRLLKVKSKSAVDKREEEEEENLKDKDSDTNKEVGVLSKLSQRCELW